MAFSDNKMCYNYYNDLALIRSMYRKSNQHSNNSNEMNLRTRPNRSRIEPKSTTKQVLLDKEYLNLKNLLPSLNNKTKVSKVCI